jgi:LysR family glycine cleavage system transcriptional activator
LAAKWLVSRLGRFAEAYPEIELKLAALMDRVDFAREDGDLAIRHEARTRRRRSAGIADTVT